MRTVTFSDARVAEFVNKTFVPVWHNRGPGFHNEEYQTEKWIFQSAFEAYTTKNICTFFLRPDGRTFFYAAGSYAPDFYLEILRAATQVSDHSRKVLTKLGNRCAELVKTMNEAIQNKKAGKILQGWCRTAEYDGIKHKHSEACGRTVIQGYQYLARVFRWFSDVEELPKYSDVERSYLYGNPFTEETGKDVESVDTREFVEVSETKAPRKKNGRRESKLAKLQERLDKLRAEFDALNKRLLEISLDDANRENCQTELLQIVDEIASCSSRRRELGAR